MASSTKAVTDEQELHDNMAFLWLSEEQSKSIWLAQATVWPFLVIMALVWPYYGYFMALYT